MSRFTYPTLKEEIATFLKSMGRLLSGSHKLADTREIDARATVCEKCEYRDKYRCTKCGCFIRIKIVMAAEDCPMGLWIKK